MSQKRQALRHPERHAPTDHGGVVICRIHAGENAGGLTDWVQDMMVYDAQHSKRVIEYGSRITIEGGPRLAHMRNSAVRIFLDGDPTWTWLHMIDSDMVPQDNDGELLPSSIDRLVATAEREGADIVGALCFVGGRSSDELYPTIYVLADEPDAAVRMHMKRVHNFPLGATVSCDATGAAGILIHRRVLEVMGEAFKSLVGGIPNPYPWFQDGQHDGREIGEDAVFCIRARQLGFKIVVDTSVEYAHRKSHLLNSTAYRKRLLEEGEKLMTLDDMPTRDEILDAAGPIEEITRAQMGAAYPEAVDG